MGLRPARPRGAAPGGDGAAGESHRPLRVVRAARRRHATPAHPGTGWPPGDARDQRRGARGRRLRLSHHLHRRGAPAHGRGRVAARGGASPAAGHRCSFGRRFGARDRACTGTRPLPRPPLPSCGHDARGLRHAPPPAPDPRLAATDRSRRPCWRGRRAGGARSRVGGEAGQPDRHHGRPGLGGHGRGRRLRLRRAAAAGARLVAGRRSLLARRPPRRLRRGGGAPAHRRAPGRAAARPG